MICENQFDRYPPITGVNKESFARFTIKKRFPVILDNILSQNAFSDETNKELRILKKQIHCGDFVIDCSKGPDCEQWQKWAAPFAKCSWYELPFYFAEACFYRLILEKTDFFSTETDPFIHRKTRDIEENYDSYIDLLEQTEMLRNQLTSGQFLRHLILLSLWGNKADLSQLNSGNRMNMQDADELIIDHSTELINIFSYNIDTVGIILDNAGTELLTDLLLAKELISLALAKTVVLHAKAYPMFVSDALEKDISFLLNRLTESKNEFLMKFSDELNKNIDLGKIRISSNPFWNSPLHFFQMNNELTEELSQSDLLVFKGDANYRRVFGDRMLPDSIRSESLTGYLPTKSVALRILKSEIVVGLTDSKASFLDQKDKNWQINGEFGMIQILN